MSISVANTIYKGMQAAGTARYHRHHRQQANLRLATIESTRGKTDPVQVRLAQDYAVDVLGWKGYAPWLVAYTAMAGTFKEGWIPDNYFGKVVVPKLNGPLGVIISSKSITGRFFDCDAFPDIGAYVNGLLFNANGEVVDDDTFRAGLFAQSDRIVFKIDNLSRGEGVRTYGQSDFDLKQVKAAGNGVFQPYIEQHEDFASFTSSPVAALRLTTLIDNQGQCGLRASYLKLGRAGEKTALSATFIRLPIDINTGIYSGDAHYDSWAMSPKHPDSPIPLEGFTVPRFHNAVALVTDLHAKHPYIRLMGWDVTVDSDNQIKILECNGGHSEIKSSEALNGPLFTDMGWENLWKQSER
jgi:hypothetical protein